MVEKNYVLMGAGYELELRDLFAAFALAGILSHDYQLPEEAAKAAYERADAMLAQRWPNVKTGEKS